MRLFRRKREEKQFLKSVQSRDMHGELQPKPLISREVVPGRQWEYLDDDGKVIGEYTIHDLEAHRRFVEAMNGNNQETWWLDVTKE